MKEKYYKYAEIILKQGLCLKQNQPLLINAPIEAIDFVNVLTKLACSIGVTDIYYDWVDDNLKHSQLEYFDLESIKQSRFWNKEIHNEYAKKNAAFLFLIDSNPDVMKDIDPHKMKVASEQSIKTRQVYRDKQANNQISWCIAAVATKVWSKLIYKDEPDSLEKLWNLIFDICLVNTDKPLTSWQEKITINHEICQKLTKLNIKTLKYTNSLGTNLNVTLPEHAIWCGGTSIINGEELLVNIPSEETFTTPNKFLTNGVVYSSMPLIHNGIIIKDIFLEFKDGKVINYDAKEGKQELKNIIETDSESNMLGEIALVDIKSKISKTNILFYETLYDENASCHIALGRGFKECLSNGNNLTDNELEHIGYNKSHNHVDLMIGTNDMSIVATTYNNQQIELFKKGSFTI